ncbi:MAG: hypothetical protein QOF62_3017 [Pyrinomonadaceae bacterium]|jgi:hypothetical protein|nr:hypothetical protein [Pyrinomonadaceae bacterium]
MEQNRPEQLPLARTEQLIVKEVDGEMLVYDLKTDQAHCLNKTAADVWKNCDGEKSLNDITAALANDSGAAVDEGAVWLALDQLKQFKLLAEVPSAPASFAGMTRRQLVRTLGVAAIALPVIVSITSPTAQAQASCGQSCTGNGGCTSNPVGCRNCNGSPGSKVCGA